MPDLPEVGLQAVFENADGFEEDAKKVAGALDEVAQAEAAAAAASDELGLGARFASLRGNVRDAKETLDDWDSALEEEARSLYDSAEAHARLEDAYKALSKKHGPELVAMLQQMEREWVDSGGAVEDWADIVEQEAGQAAGALEKIMALLSLGALTRVSQAFGQIGGQITAFAKDATLTAARVEELGVVLDNLAVQNDLSAAAMREQVEAVRAQGIQADVAYNLVSQFVRSNLDLAKASDLARVAQDAAVISMEDSSQALAGILHGILTLQPEVLRYRGLIVDLESEYKKWSDETGRARLSMTGAEKQAIALNAVLAEGASVTGTYESAMESASKQLRSFPRYITDLKAEFGDALLPVFTEAVFAAKDFVKWLEAIPEPLKAVIAVTGTAAGGFLQGTSALVGFASQVGLAAIALRELGVQLNITKAALLGPVGFVGGLLAIAGVGVGVLSYLEAEEQAHRAEAAAIVDSTEEYENYVVQAEAAELGSYALSESLYEMVKAAEAAGEALTAAQLTEQMRELQSALLGVTGWQWLDEIPVKTRSAEVAMASWMSHVEDAIPDLTDLQLAILEDEQTLERWAERLGIATDRIPEFIARTQEMVDAEQVVRLAHDASRTSIGDHEEIMLGLASTTGELIGLNEQYEGIIAESISYEEELKIAQEARLEQLKLLARAQEIYNASLEGLAARSAEQIVRANEQKDAAILRADQDLTASLADLWDDYGDRVGDILESIAQVNADLAADLEAAQARFLADRLAAEQQYAQDLAALEASLAQQREQLAADLEQRLADLQERYDEARADAAEALAEDLGRIEENHLDRLEALAEQHAEYIESLEERHQQNLLSIQEKYDRKREAIEEKYRTEETEQERIDAERERLLAELARLRELDEAHMTGIDYGPLIQAILNQLDVLRQAELDALDEQQRAEEEAEEEAHQERLRAEQERWEEAQAAEEARYQEERQARQDAYQEQLEDLRERYQEERAAAEEANREALAALEERSRAERAALEQRYREQLAALDERLREERERLNASAAEQRQRLLEQLLDERENYVERVAELKAHHKAQVAATEQRYKDEADAIRDGLLLEKLRIIDGLSAQSTEFAQAYKDEKEALEDYLFGPGGRYEKQHKLEGDILDMLNLELPDQAQAFFDAYTRQETDLQNHVDAMLGTWAHYFSELAAMGGAQSPSRWMIDFGRDLTEGLERGLDIGGVLAASLRDFERFQGGVEARVPELPSVTVQAPSLAAPALPPGPSSAQTTNYNLSADFTNSNLMPSIATQFRMMEMTH